MRTTVVLALALLPACWINNDLTYPPCTPALTTVAVDDASLGFSATDVALMLATNAPTSMTWDELTLGDATTDASLAASLSGDPSVADPSVHADCDPGPWLQVPVHLDITLAGGDVQASGDTTLYVRSASPEDVSLNVDWEIPATLSGAYADQFDTYFADEWAPRGYEVHGTYVTINDTWAEPGIDIEFQAGLTADKSNAAGAVWRGSWSLP